MREAAVFTRSRLTPLNAFSAAHETQVPRQSKFTAILLYELCFQFLSIESGSTEEALYNNERHGRVKEHASVTNNSLGPCDNKV